MKSKKEIVLFGLHMGLGGAERVFSELALEWVNMGIKVSIIQARPSMEVINYKLDERINLYDLKDTYKIFRRIRQTIDLITVLRKKQEAILIVFMPQTKLLTAMASVFINNRIVFSERNDPARSPSNKIYRLIRNFTYEVADICIFQTNDAKNYFSRRIQMKSVIIKNPINPVLPIPNFRDRKKIVVTACRLENQKNLPLLIDAFSSFVSEYPDYTLRIYGSGSLEDYIHYYIIGRNLQGKAKLMGFSSNIYEEIKDCSIYVSSSDYEGISNSMLEAMALGIPTVCTDCPCGGARETIKNGENGILVPVRDAGALCDAMKKIASDEQFARHISQNATKIREILAINKIAAEWIDVIYKERY